MTPALGFECQWQPTLSNRHSLATSPDQAVAILSRLKTLLTESPQALLLLVLGLSWELQSRPLLYEKL